MKIESNQVSLNGYLRYGHMELDIDNPKEIAYFESLTKEKQLEYLNDTGDWVIDDYRITDVCNDIDEIYID